MDRWLSLRFMTPIRLRALRESTAPRITTDRRAAHSGSAVASRFALLVLAAVLLTAGFAVLAGFVTRVQVATADSSSPAWSDALSLPSPSDTRSPDPVAYLNAISCAEPETCTMVGSYLNASNDNALFAVSEVSGEWSQGTPITPLPMRPFNQRSCRGRRI
jgi:hypothetical protein